MFSIKQRLRRSLFNHNEFLLAYILVFTKMNRDIPSRAFEWTIHRIKAASFYQFNIPTISLKMKPTELRKWSPSPRQATMSHHSIIKIKTTAINKFRNLNIFSLRQAIKGWRRHFAVSPLHTAHHTPTLTLPNVCVCVCVFWEQDTIPYPH